DGGESRVRGHDSTDGAPTGQKYVLRLIKRTLAKGADDVGEDVDAQHVERWRHDGMISASLPFGKRYDFYY
ncbi:hypothetical protein, partial [Deinococcus yavapaiensis]|uniref:hypothetical protein n=1 Tax=Deinococcus yavapaiensis TaxID=309889 RepID=UPI001B86CE44